MKRGPVFLPKKVISQEIKSVEIKVNPIDEVKIYEVYQKPDGGKLNLSNLKSCLTLGYLEKLQISTVVNACSIIQKCKPVEQGGTYIRVPGVNYYFYEFNDPPDLKCYKQAVCEILPIIDQELSSGKNVLVHCQAGLSRSVGIVASYLTVYSKYFLDGYSFNQHNYSEILPKAMNYLTEIKKIEPKISIIKFVQELEDFITSLDKEMDGKSRHHEFCIRNI